MLLAAAALIVAMGWLLAGDVEPGAGDTLADRVLGQPDFVHNAANFAKAGSLYFPSAAAIDSRGHLYIADSRDSRVLGWHNAHLLTSGAPADLVIGQPDFVSGGCNHGVAKGDRLGVGADSLCLLSESSDNDEFGGLTVDGAGNLFVADPANSRVLEYDSPFDMCTSIPCLGIGATNVIGQPDFTSTACNLGLDHASASTLCGANSVALDSLGNLYIADTGNDRILEYNTPFNPDSGEPGAGDFVADLVFGPSNFYNGGSQCLIDPLCSPLGIAVDTKGNLWVADSGNNEVLEFNTPLNPASGEPGAGDTIPDFIITNSYSTGGCPYSGRNPNDTSVCDPSSVALDAAGNLFVADRLDSRVVEFNTPLNPASGEPGAGDATADMVFGQATFNEALCNHNPNSTSYPNAAYEAPPDASALCYPYGVAVDPAGNLYIADQNNNRLTKYDSPLNANSGEAGAGDTVADVVLGQRDFTHDGVNIPDAASLFEPNGNVVDNAGHLWVADTGNGRVLGWRSVASFANQVPADLVVGKRDFNTVGCQNLAYLCDPVSVATDPAGNLYVADVFNSRVLEYDSPFAACSKFPCVGPAPNLVFGQPGLVTKGCNGGDTFHPGASTLCGPLGVAVDSIGNLYIVDSNNHRVLEYNTPLNPRSGEPGAGDTMPDTVFGQEDFNTAKCWGNGTNAATLCYPGAVAVDSYDNVYVIDNVIRMLEYNTPLNPWSGEPGAGDTVADFVLGQPDLTSNDCSTPTASTYCGLSAVTVDLRGDVYLGDTYHNRILEFSAPIGSHLTADRIFGQRSFAGSDCNSGRGPGDLFGVGPDSLCFAVVPGGDLGGLAADSNLNVYAGDVFNNRLLVYNNPLAAPIPVTAPTPTPVGQASGTPTPTAAATSPPTPTATAIAGHPFISSMTNPILAGASFSIKGSGFSAGSEVNFFVSTAFGGVNTGPLIPAAKTSTRLEVEVPADSILGQGFVAVQVLNTDQGYVASNVATALLQGAAAAGIPSITSINGVGLASSSMDPRFAANNVETVVIPGSVLSLGGSGFDVINGVAVDIFCACAGGKVGPFMLGPGNPGLHSTLIQFTLPPTGPVAPPVGPSAFVVSNKGPAGTYMKKSNAVSAPIGAAISIVSVSQSGSTVTVGGTGFSSLTVINFFNSRAGRVVNLGGLTPDGTPKITLVIDNETRFTLSVPPGAVPGPSYVEAVEPPFVPFASSGTDPGGAFILK